MRASIEEFEGIRSLWIAHSKAEDARDLDGLIATLTASCVYEFEWTGHRWRGHDGARSCAAASFLGTSVASPCSHFTGISDPYEDPADAEVVIDTAGTTPEEAAQQVLLHIEHDGYIA
jgi:hypothetical protein